MNDFFLQSKQKLEMIYLDTDNQFSQRIICVIKINDEMILAYCYAKRKIRTFKRKNILSIGKARREVGA